MGAKTDKKQIVIFIRNHLAMGGIEQYVYMIAKKMQDKGAQIIWVKHPRTKLDQSYEDVFLNEKTIIWDKKIHSKKIRNLVNEGYSEIKIICFDLYPFAKAEKFKRNFKLCPVHTFYFVPHFTGDTLFLEEAYHGKKRELVRERMKPILQKMHNSGNIRYFAKTHMEKMETTYGYRIENANDYFVPPKDKEHFFDEERCRALAERKRFNLLTISRFEFPHKGYIIGLIHEYAKLKEKYPQLELTIIGYGDGLNRIQEEIAALNDNAKMGIHMVGKTPYEELKAFYDDANLNISVAGVCSQGARNGTLSIPARHYDYNCEVFGFLSKDNPSTISSEPGMPVAPFIESVLNMSSDEYCALCKEGFDVFNNESVRARKSLEVLENNSQQSTLLHSDIFYMEKEELKRNLRGKYRKLIRIIKHTVNQK